MTMPVMLPRKRGVKVDKVHFVDFGGQLKPFMGGPVQTILRLGSRFALEVTIPLMRAEPDGRIWSSRLTQAKIFGALMHYRQDGLTIGLPGSPVVDGAGQTGFALALRGLRPSYAIREGQAVPVIVSGRRYLYFASQTVVAGTDGRAAVPIYPMIRRSPADGDICEIAAPIIQGSISGNEVSWTRLSAPFCDFGTITITEDE
ncbi:hypothetical protein [Novosphingobium sp. SG707]|uniref:hypothetical protein n=1 Tax=Novosphingobium sp. SG707 TaxID=2586996 RepID=UPI0014480C54|nr:hypothetical protein [Novosphingobium sp. SG707]NKI99582.1 hypothetical protein [Novosphingobium sp. SG707]